MLYIPPTFLTFSCVGVRLSKEPEFCLCKVHCIFFKFLSSGSCRNYRLLSYIMCQLPGKDFVAHFSKIKKMAIILKRYDPVQFSKFRERVCEISLLSITSRIVYDRKAKFWNYMEPESPLKPSHCKRVTEKMEKNVFPIVYS